MISDILFAIGAVAIFEGLVLVLAPSYLEQVMTFLRSQGPNTLRYIGFSAVIIGVLLLSLSKT